MSRHLRRLDRRILFTSTLVLPLCVLVSACGGGGGVEVASIPPPPPLPTPTPTPTGLPVGTTTYSYPAANPIDVKTSWLDSPATRLGSYALIGRLSETPANGDSTSYRVIAPGEFSMGVATSANGGLSYTLNAPVGVLPADRTSSVVPSAQISWDINSTVAYRYTNTYGDTPQYLGERLTGFAKAADGSETQLFSYDYTRGAWGFGVSLGGNTYLATNLDYDLGFSYVSMGEWSWSVVDDVTGNRVPGNAHGQLLFVNGDRTPAAGIPLSGTATYDAHTLEMRSSSGAIGIPFSLTADFGLRTIATSINQDFQNYGSGDGDPIQGIHVAGSAPFSNDGSFDIPLTGTVNYSYANEPAPPANQPATGDMNGAFFGPNAEQIGGTLSLQRSVDQTPLYQDAFVGQQHHP